MRTTLVALLAAASAASACVDDPELGVAEGAESVWQWTPDVTISGQASPYQVGLQGYAPDGATQRLYMLRAEPSTGRLSLASFDGRTWTMPRATSLYADQGPALVAYGGRLVAIYHARGENRLMMAQSSPDVSTWFAPRTAGTSLDRDTLLNAPAAVVHGGELFVGYCRRTSAGDQVWVDRYTGASWVNEARYSATFRCKHVAMGSSPGGRLHIVWTAESGYTGAWSMFGRDGLGRPRSDWARSDLYPMTSRKPPSILRCNGVTHFVHGGDSTPNEIWWTRYEGEAWVPDVRVPDQASDGGAALGCFGTGLGQRTIMVHNGGTDQLWWSEYGD